MKNLTTPQAVLGGLALIALAVASIPYSSNIVTSAHANPPIEVAEDVQKVTICNSNGLMCGYGIPSSRNDKFFELPLSIVIDPHWQTPTGPIPVTVD